MESGSPPPLAEKFSIEAVQALDAEGGGLKKSGRYDQWIEVKGAAGFELVEEGGLEEEAEGKAGVLNRLEANVI
ncbi:hypothetical protein HPP92_005789 [Vanilla planifolia]|uniref:Uncharacterized protein n=1 Tax=Vanilla planifolia TaxID=51239 RepID=A0A835RVR7_VANPL|nr:hypothetical protein HPP92_006075 [Vanilla planifolia]KAG0494795.1 hypothetical protein HPP92_005789 [Vanilla planifolia]